MIEKKFRTPLTTYNSSEPINSAPFSRAKPLLSPRLLKLNSFNCDWKRCNTSKGFSTVAHICHDKSYFLTAKHTFPRQNLLFTAKLTFSRQNFLFHGKTFFSTPKLTFKSLASSLSPILKCLVY